MILIHYNPDTLNPINGKRTIRAAGEQGDRDAGVQGGKTTTGGRNVSATTTGRNRPKIDGLTLEIAR
jgi:hypothetical protein